MNKLQLLFAFISLQIVSIFAQDPADSWLVYAVTSGNGKRITWANATWVVPDYPSLMCKKKKLNFDSNFAKGDQMHLDFGTISTFFFLSYTNSRIEIHINFQVRC
jgi:hypothetical protein